MLAEQAASHVTLCIWAPTPTTAAAAATTTLGLPTFRAHAHAGKAGRVACDILHLGAIVDHAEGEVTAAQLPPPDVGTLA